MERGSGGGGRREREKLRGSGGLLWGGKEVWGQREGVVGWKKREKRLLWVQRGTGGGVEHCGGELREWRGGGQWGTELRLQCESSVNCSVHSNANRAVIGSVAMQTAV